MSSFYSYMARVFEHKYAEMALELLAIKRGDSVLEIGFGPGHSLQHIARSSGNEGSAYGIDISSGMLEVTRRRLKKAGLMNRVSLCLGDATKLPYRGNIFDAVFLSFTLELFDTPEISTVLNEVNRVLKPKGRLGIVSMSRSYGEPLLLRLYEWAHKKWPKYLDCRPIYVEESVRDARFNILKTQAERLLGLPLEITIAAKQ